MESGPSQNLQSWLGRQVDKWMDYDGTGDPPTPSGTVQIILQDVHHQKVASWTLANAYPVSWSGPTMDAKQNAVAIETLTIEHGGFLPPSSGAGA
jgi:phage tail-like protein